VRVRVAQEVERPTEELVSFLGLLSAFAIGTGKDLGP